MMESKSSSSSEPVRLYDVYLSFRGPDTRRGLVGHLYSALVRSQVSVFKDDDELPKGGMIKDTLNKAIQNSRIAIVVFSKEYASSRWCLDELAQIMECQKSNGLMVLPVFYDVKPHVVRHQSGRYEDTFAHHEINSPDRVKIWRAALTEAARLQGFLLGDRPEYLLVRDIVRFVLSELEHSRHDNPFHVPADLYSHFKARYDVFLSFRGSETSRGFTGHLYSALVQSKLNAFVGGQDIQPGTDVACALTEAIENSTIAIVVFSEDYASSHWCLGEVAKIMECRGSKGLTVIPVFYHVQPRIVREQSGRYEDVFALHEGRYPLDEVKRWRDALIEAANLSGFLWGERPDYLLVQDIVRIVLSRLEPLQDDIQLCVPANLVGMDSHLKAMKEPLDMDSDEVRMVALCGMGGIGKTTIAKTIFNEIGRYFTYKCFSANVRETCQYSLTRGLLELQQGLLAQMGEQVEISDVDQGSATIKRICCSSRTLLVIDDINHPQQLEKLAGACDWFGPGSKIIITTQDRDLVNREEIELYEVPLLEDPDAYLLFKRTLSLENDEIGAYEELTAELLK